MVDSESDAAGDLEQMLVGTLASTDNAGGGRYGTCSRFDYQALDTYLGKHYPSLQTIYARFPEKIQDILGTIYCALDICVGTIKAIANYDISDLASGPSNFPTSDETAPNEGSLEKRSHADMEDNSAQMSVSGGTDIVGKTSLKPCKKKDVLKIAPEDVEQNDDADNPWKMILYDLKQFYSKVSSLPKNLNEKIGGYFSRDDKVENNNGSDHSYTALLRELIQVYNEGDHQNISVSYFISIVPIITNHFSEKRKARENRSVEEREMEIEARFRRIGLGIVALGLLVPTCAYEHGYFENNSQPTQTTTYQTPVSLEQNLSTQPTSGNYGGMWPLHPDQMPM